MISLQKFLFHPEVARHFDMKSAALYERQRALVRVGLLPRPSTRGRSAGGALATPDALAFIVLALLVTETLSEVDDRMKAWAKMRPFETTEDEEKPTYLRIDRCPITGQRSLQKALSAVIERSEERMVVGVHRKTMTASISAYHGTSDEIRSDFGKPYPDAPGVVVFAALPNLSTISQLRRKLAEPREP